MSTALESTIANARYRLPGVVEQYASGAPLKGRDPHAIAALFRRLGVSRMFTEGVNDPLFIAQMQSSGAYLFGLRRLTDEEKVTSRAGAFWDAIGGEYWDAASQIARQSRMTVNPTWEHEDDFLYVAFLMTRYFVGPDSSDEKSAAAHARAQQDMLKRWEEVLDGAFDPRLDVCGALFARQGEAFWTALLEMADAREADVQLKRSRGSLPDEDAAWFGPFWGEGLALLRLAERDGLKVADGCPMVPEIARARNRLVFDPQAWRRLDLLG